jgi:hypothetical protein
MFQRVLKMRFLVLAALAACAIAVPLTHPRELLQVEYKAPTASAASNECVLQPKRIRYAIINFSPLRYGSQLVRPVSEGVGKRDFSFNVYVSTTVSPVLF